MPTYDKFAAFYDKVLAPFEKRFLSRWRQEALSELPKNADLLELGSGTGLNFRFYPPARKAVSSELSLAMLSVAASRKADNLLVQADAGQLPFSSDSFDAVFATLVFCSVSDPEAVFKEIERVIRPGGVIILLEHVRPNGVLGFFFDLLNMITVPLIDDHFNRRTADIAEACGLLIVEKRMKAFTAVNLLVLKTKKMNNR